MQQISTTLPDGTIIKAGQTDASDSGTVVFSVPFVSKCVSVVASECVQDGLSGAAVPSQDVTGFKFVQKYAVPLNWIAYGK